MWEMELITGQVSNLEHTGAVKQVEGHPLFSVSWRNAMSCFDQARWMLLLSKELLLLNVIFLSDHLYGNGTLLELLLAVSTAEG
jgi:hypothetical protein